MSPRTARPPRAGWRLRAPPWRRRGTRRVERQDRQAEYRCGNAELEGRPPGTDQTGDQVLGDLREPASDEALLPVLELEQRADVVGHELAGLQGRLIEGLAGGLSSVSTPTGRPADLITTEAMAPTCQRAMNSAWATEMRRSVDGRTGYETLARWSNASSITPSRPAIRSVLRSNARHGHRLDRHSAPAAETERDPLTVQAAAQGVGHRHGGCIETLVGFGRRKQIEGQVGGVDALIAQGLLAPEQRLGPGCRPADRLAQLAIRSRARTSRSSATTPITSSPARIGCASWTRVIGAGFDFAFRRSGARTLVRSISARSATFPTNSRQASCAARRRRQVGFRLIANEQQSGFDAVHARVQQRQPGPIDSPVVLGALATRSPGGVGRAVCLRCHADHQRHRAPMLPLWALESCLWGDRADIAQPECSDPTLNDPSRPRSFISSNISSHHRLPTIGPPASRRS